MKHFVKIITGYRADEYITVPAQEAHKAYYLFTHPNERGIFSNGRPLIGKDIKDIKPDYHATMGWNPQHRITADDMNEIVREGVYKRFETILKLAKEVSEVAGLKANGTPLREAAKTYLGYGNQLPERAGLRVKLETLKQEKLGRLTANSRRS